VWRGDAALRSRRRVRVTGECYDGECRRIGVLMKL
jgi:hypothetical protein